ncbi:MAG: PadR family transcriptional regulator [Oscillospiraceae bacterium]|nr:PadR family transcriptional regulator [Oscillospiraceae bacterium]
MEKTASLLESGGYRVSKAEPHYASDSASCPCNGGTLDRFMQPIILHILSAGPLNGYATQKKMASYATFGDRVPDMSATYRFLKRMEGRGLLSVEDGKYSLTAEGHRCLENWRRTIQAYGAVMNTLAEQLE